MTMPPRLPQTPDGERDLFDEGRQPELPPDPPLDDDEEPDEEPEDEPAHRSNN